MAPVCLHDLVNVKNSKYAFRYSNILEIPQVRTTHYGKMSFKFAAASLWNGFPTISELKIVFLNLRVSFSPGMGRNVAVLREDSFSMLGFIIVLLILA